MTIFGDARDFLMREYRRRRPFTLKAMMKMNGFTPKLYPGFDKPPYRYWEHENGKIVEIKKAVFEDGEWTIDF